MRLQSTTIMGLALICVFFFYSPLLLFSNPSDTEKHGVTMQLQKTIENGRVLLICSFLNNASNTEALDRRLLNPTLLTKITLEDGTLVEKFPPSTPRELRKSDIVLIESNKKYVVSFELRSITDQKLDRPALVQCVYDGRASENLNDVNFFQEKIESNIVRVDPQ